jgi:hypothetical protein
MRVEYISYPLFLYELLYVHTPIVPGLTICGVEFVSYSSLVAGLDLFHPSVQLSIHLLLMHPSNFNRNLSRNPDFEILP